MFNPNDFLNVPQFTVTPAAMMVFEALERHGIPNTQETLQYDHMGHVRESIKRMACKSTVGGFVLTTSPLSLRVVDSILPDDFGRRCVICMDTEVEYVRHQMLRQSGLIGKDV